MKTAISLPDSLFLSAEQLAQQLHLSRSELYARAIAAYLEIYRAQNITEQLNHVYATESSSPDPVLSQLAALSLPQDEW